MNLGNKILKIRKDNKMSQEEFAEILNVTRQTVSNWENGNNYPDIETLIMISDKFKVSLDILLKGDKEMIKDMNKKIKNNKILKRIIIVLNVIIVLIVVLIIGLKIYEEIDYYWHLNNFDKDAPSYAAAVNKCNYEGKRLKLMAIIEQDCNYKYKKWYEVPGCTSDYSKKPVAFKILDNNTKEVQNDLMENSNINVDDYENAYDLLKAMEDYVTSIGGKCDNQDWRTNWQTNKN